MKVEIMFTKSDTLISDGIALVTGCPASHVLVKIGDYVWEARGDKPHSQVIKQKYTDMIKQPQLTHIWAAEIFVYDIVALIKWLDSKVGTRYDYANTTILQLVKLATGKLLFQKKTNVADNQYQCAEFTAHAVKLHAINSWINKPIASYSPKDHFVKLDPTLIYSKN